MDDGYGARFFFFDGMLFFTPLTFTYLLEWGVFQGGGGTRHVAKSVFSCASVVIFVFWQSFGLSTCFSHSVGDEVCFSEKERTERLSSFFFFFKPCLRRTHRPCHSIHGSRTTIHLPSHGMSDHCLFVRWHVHRREEYEFFITIYDCQEGEDDAACKITKNSR